MVMTADLREVSGPFFLSSVGLLRLHSLFCRVPAPFFFLKEAKEEAKEAKEEEEEEEGLLFVWDPQKNAKQKKKKKKKRLFWDKNEIKMKLKTSTS